MIEPERIQPLNTNLIQSKDFVLYWMQQAQRTHDNHALEYAIHRANTLHQPLLVFFGLTDSFPEANSRHYTFMLQGLQETITNLKKRNISHVIKHGEILQTIQPFITNASLVITDRGYLRIQKHWRKHIASTCQCHMLQIETDAIIPVETASHKEEYSAATIRPKIHSLLPHFLKPLKQQTLQNSTLKKPVESFDIKDISKTLQTLNIDTTVTPVETFTGGTHHALTHLTEFLNNKLHGFADHRNDPTKEHASHLSPYLHFGQISPLTIALKIQNKNTKDISAFLEELIIRRELAINYVHYNPCYDQYKGLPTWAKTSLKLHEKDKRPYLYTIKELENAQTHDSYWNAAQKEMTTTGKMQGYMRMYWGKKIIEWTKSPQQAFQIALTLNNKYELDGRDPNGFTGIAWCFGKHDRPWKERPIFGKIRYMNDIGLKRKFNIDNYASKWKTL